eukprot:TRINITY_DN85_c0_g1_i2.p1 TRINITY_DN85_c0_g1~~TRINITY_DN85_c0_g1_i2.p1  ORF type:complete len:661 (-),score=136.50 TRINITY_DN85_c0_g1_i2:390-2324(-)
MANNPKIKPKKSSSDVMKSPRDDVGSPRSQKTKSTAKLSKPLKDGEEEADDELDPKQHRFQKKTFSHPTWCPFAQKFIWGINKSGYECRVCNMPVSRRFIGEAKTTQCGTDYDAGVDTVQQPTTQVVPKGQVFTVYLPHGAKKSVLYNANEPLRNVLEKVCQARGLVMSEYVPEDTNGEVIPLDTVLSKIEGFEITFTKKDVVDVKSSKPKKEPTNSDKSSTKSKNTKGSQPSVSEDKSQGAQTPKSEASSNHLSVSAQNNLKRGTTNDSSGKPKRKVIEQYEFGQELGSGAFSVVKSATHKESGEVVAIKVLDKYEDDDEQTQKFKQEIAIISSLHHENIVQFHELDDDDQNFYVVMELVGGGELFDYIIDSVRIAEQETVCVIAQVLKAIEYMHDIGTCHRDLKPENLLYKSKDHKIIKIADFGESKSFKNGKLTTYCGTPDYMAPEIIKGEPYGPEVDVWAIGVITYVMLAGFPPFDGEDDVGVFESILAIRFDFPSPEWDNVSELARDFIRSIFIDDPKKRLTASEALAHPWIVNNVSVELRTNVKRAEPLEDDRKIGKKASTSKHMSRAKPQVTELIEDTIKMIQSNDSAKKLSELKTMLRIVGATTGAKGNQLEDVIFEAYWTRVHELRNSISKKKKK